MQLPIGQVVADRYRVVGVLGRGGMAIVHEAHDQVLDRRVALKVLSEHLLDDDRAVRRFEREARAAAALNHPNIVGVFDAVADGDIHALVMELVQGRSLADRLRDEGPLPVDGALGLAEQVAMALGTAHDRGLVHRDVKPSNILLTGAGGVKVADFGIARAMSSAATQTGVVMGSVPYVAPEQLQGDADADPRSDLYALGCVLYEALTGRPPFVADTTAGVLGQHLHVRPPAVTDTRSDAGPHVDALVAGLLAKEPSDRPPDAHDLQRRLALVRHGRAPDPSPGGPASSASTSTTTGDPAAVSPGATVDPGDPTALIPGAMRGLDGVEPSATVALGADSPSTEVLGKGDESVGGATGMAPGAGSNEPTRRLGEDPPGATAWDAAGGGGRGRNWLIVLGAIVVVVVAAWVLSGLRDDPTPLVPSPSPSAPAMTEPPAGTPTPGPVTESVSTPEPTSEPDPDPTTEPSAEPTAEPTPEPTGEPSSEPTSPPSSPPDPSPTAAATPA